MRQPDAARRPMTSSAEDAVATDSHVAAGRLKREVRVRGVVELHVRPRLHQRLLELVEGAF